MGDFFKFLWPSQNIWTLTMLLQNFFQHILDLVRLHVSPVAPSLWGDQKRSVILTKLALQKPECVAKERWSKAAYARATTDVVATAACGAAAAGSNMRKVFLGKAFFSMHSKTFEREAQKSTCNRRGSKSHLSTWNCRICLIISDFSKYWFWES